MTRPPKDLGASVQARLRNVARERGEDVQVVLLQFVLERLLHRLACSPHRRDFVLKGAMLFTAWTKIAHRATRDLDLLGCGPSELPRLAAIFRTICLTEVDPDGVNFDADSVASSRIREDQLYEAVRVLLTASVGTARISVQVDIGFGDAVTPHPVEMAFPTLLGQPPVQLLTYPREVVVAEKFHAMVSLGLLNSRMKDFYDLSVLAAQFPFAGPPLGAAIAATFARRQTALPVDLPVALSREFALDNSKRVQWAAFVRRNKLPADASDLASVLARLQTFLWPIVLALQGRQPMPGEWSPSGPWS